MTPLAALREKLERVEIASRAMVATPRGTTERSNAVEELAVHREVLRNAAVEALPALLEVAEAAREYRLHANQFTRPKSSFRESAAALDKALSSLGGGVVP